MMKMYRTSENNNSVTNEGNSENTENNNSEDNNGSDNENIGSDDNSKSHSGDNEVLNLGETGEVETTIGDYEITFESFELLDEIDGEESVMNDGIFVLVDTTIEIAGEDSIDAKEIRT